MRTDDSYQARVVKILAELGVPASYGLDRQMPFYSEAKDLVSVGLDIYGRERQLAPHAAERWAELRTAAHQDGVMLLLVSAFRSLDYQRRIFERKLNAGEALEAILKVNAPPGYSEHHTGRAVDLTSPGSAPLGEEFERTAAFAWLVRHAHRFGFAMTYPRENRYGVAYEPWHWAVQDAMPRNQGDAMSETVDLYNNVYADFGSRAEAAVRHHAFGEDIGQSSWLTAAEWLRFADLLQVRDESHVLEVGSGSGGPAVYLAGARGCRVTGIDVNEHGVRNAERLAVTKGVADRVTFQIVDASRPFPFPPAAFDAVVSNDAMCHIPNRLEVLGEFHRVLRPRGRMLFTDAMIVTGMVSQEELAIRSSIGWYLFLPPGENERLIGRAGFTLLSSEDVTAEEEMIAQRWHAAREEHRDELVAREGDANFAGLQRFLACVHRLSAERRLSRYCYLAEKPPQTRAGESG